MATIKIDDKEYDSDKLPQEILEQLNALRHTTSEIARLHLQLAAMQTANNAYSRSVKEYLERAGQDGDEKVEGKSFYEGDGAISFDNL